MFTKLKNSLELPQFLKPISYNPSKSQCLHLNVSETNHASLLSSIGASSLRKTQQVHAQILVGSLFTDTHLANLTIESYFKCNQPQLAFLTFDQMPRKDSASWAQIIASYSMNGQSEKSLESFHLMNLQGHDPNRSSLISALKSCSDLSKFILGKQLHSQIAKRISHKDVIFDNMLIVFYSRCGELSEARKVFDEIPERDLVSWTSMLSGYSQNWLSKEAWEFFVVMNSQDMRFSHYAFSVAAKACGELKGTNAGEQLHCLTVKTGFECHTVVSSALLDMYSKCGKIQWAHKIFDSILEPNIISWTSIITGYVQINEGEEALNLFRHLIRTGVRPDPFALSSIITACANIPALEFGKQVHTIITKLGFEFQVFAGNSLVRMYSKCGCLSDAERAHSLMSERNVVTWTSMIAGFAQHGHGIEALVIFVRMLEANCKPNSITLIAVLSACARAGLVDEGMKYFESMSREFGIEAREEHYTCMVDLLARGGRVKEAEGFMKEMPFEPSANTWGALLNGCRAKGEIELGLRCAEELFRLEPRSASTHVLLANMYAANGKWDEMGRIRGLMKEKGLKKESGYSWVEVGKEMTVFSVGDSQYPQSNMVYAMLHLLSMDMEKCSQGHDE